VKKTGQPLRRQVAGDAGRKEAGPGRGDGLVVYIGGKDLDGVAALEPLEALLQQHRDAIGLLARRAARHPDPEGLPRGLGGADWPQGQLVERLEDLRVAEELGHADEQVPKERHHLGGRLLQILDVALDRLDLVHRHPPPDPPANRVGLVLGKIVAGLGPQEDADLLEGVFGDGG